MLSVELFSGCGGLALGLAKAGFKHAMVIEQDAAANATLLANQKRGVLHVADWQLISGDAREVDYSSLEERIDLVSGGPPCQPFSIGGNHRGPEDERNMWPEAIRAVRELRPKAFLFENVRGLLRPAFDCYLTFLRLQLSWPEIAPKQGEPWLDHFARLLRHERTGRAPTYSVLIQGINAADYGAPQKRHRAIIMGIRSDLAPDLSFPPPTHSHDALVWSQRVTGDYWKRHGIGFGRRPPLDETDKLVIKRPTAPKELPWRTVRDAIGDLPRPRLNGDPALPNHQLHPGARLYPKHTGSSWDEPAKALKAGDHGVPGGENIIVGSSGSVRYFTIREMARLQGFPDDFTIGGAWKTPIKQLGNAVPIHVGFVFGLAIKRLISGQLQKTTDAELVA
ncbi:MAG TPA: DNA cytosine methyltransferase [Polyangia bacterium]|nr:DNA cytosine methyltransferase [Polyangia bacterium]